MKEHVLGPTVIIKSERGSGVENTKVQDLY